MSTMASLNRKPNSSVSVIIHVGGTKAECCGKHKRRAKCSWARSARTVECVMPESVPMLSEKLLQKLELFKKPTKRHWEGRNIIVPTANSK